MVPYELLLHIIEYASSDIETLVSIARTCKTMHKAILVEQKPFESLYADLSNEVVSLPKCEYKWMELKRRQSTRLSFVRMAFQVQYPEEVKRILKDRYHRWHNELDLLTIEQLLTLYKVHYIISKSYRYPAAYELDQAQARVISIF